MKIKEESEEIESNNRGRNQAGKEAYGMRDFHCYAFESVKKRRSLSVLLTGMTFEFGFREKKVIQKLSEW